MSARRKVLIVRFDNNGDVLLSGPAIRAVAAADTMVTLLCGPRGVDAAHLLIGVTDTIVHRAAWIDPEPEAVDRAQILSLVDQLSARHFDEAIVLTSFHQSPLPTALVLRMAGVPRIAAISEDYPGSLLDVRHRVPDDIHEVRRALSLVEAAGYPLPRDDDDRLKIDRPAPRSTGKPYIVVHPGASAPARTWPADKHAALTRALVRRGRAVVVTGGPGEESLTAEVAGAADPLVTDLGGRLQMARLADIIAGAELIVVGNTGPAHIAAAVGTPVVSLFSPVVPAVRWHPWRVPFVLLGDQKAACATTRARLCPIPGHPCLESVSVHDVLDAIDQLAPVREPVEIAS